MHKYKLDLEIVALDCMVSDSTYVLRACYYLSEVIQVGYHFTWDYSFCRILVIISETSEVFL